MPLSTSDFILTHLVIDEVVDPEPVAIAISAIVEASPCGDDPGWSDLLMADGRAATIATPFGELIPVSRDS
jgi:hypothetical protein